MAVICFNTKKRRMKRDVGMACQKQGRENIKVKVNIQSLIHPYIFSVKM